MSSKLTELAATPQKLGDFVDGKALDVCVCRENVSQRTIPGNRAEKDTDGEL